MTRDETFDAVIAQRLALAGILDTLAPEGWNVDSLCAGWRVREVVAHLVTCSSRR